MAQESAPDEVLAQIRRMTVKDREYVDAELMHDAYESGRLTEPAAVMDEIVRRANDAIAHTDRGVSREQAVTSARRAMEETRRRRS